MKKDTAQKLTEVIKKIVQKEVNQAVQDIGKVMAQIIKEQVKKQVQKEISVINEYDLVGKTRGASPVREDFNKKMNYGYTLTQAANTNGINIGNYNPRPQPQYEEQQPIVKTGNKVLDNIFSEVAAEMPEDFGNDYAMSTGMRMPMTPNPQPNSLNELNLNMNPYGRQPQQQMLPIQPQQPIQFDLPVQDTEGGLIHLDSVSPNVINKLVKNYRPTINKLETMKPTAGHALRYNDVGTVDMNKYENG